MSFFLWYLKYVFFKIHYFLLSFFNGAHRVSLDSWKFGNDTAGRGLACDPGLVGYYKKKLIIKRFYPYDVASPIANWRRWASITNSLLAAAAGQKAIPKSEKWFYDELIVVNKFRIQMCQGRQVFSKVCSVGASDCVFIGSHALIRTWSSTVDPSYLHESDLFSYEAHLNSCWNCLTLSLG